MAKIPCEFRENGGQKCTMPCVEVDGDTLVIIGRHMERNMRERRHVNRIRIREILRIASEELGAEHIVKILSNEFGKSELTRLLKKV